MKKLKWNRKLSILVLIMFITVTFASFNTNLFIDGKAYVRVDRDIRITDIQLINSQNGGYETTAPEYTNNSVMMDVNLPQTSSTLTYQITITNVSEKRYRIEDIIEDIYTNSEVKYELTNITVGNIVEPHTTKTFTIAFSSNKRELTPEEDVYETLTYDFEYTGEEQEFIVPFSGEYTLEVWGAQGGAGWDNLNNQRGSIGGYGGYSKGTISLKQNEILYINVGGKGDDTPDEYNDNLELNFAYGGYNGGGEGKRTINASWGAGGGATHIAIRSGLLSSLKPNTADGKGDIIMVAGAGGGGGDWYEADVIHNQNGGSGGGIKGEDGKHYLSGGTRPRGGTQTAGGNSEKTSGIQNNGSFGLGGYVSIGGSGGGSGYYGGGGGRNCGASGAGGSGYIGYYNLTNKEMYCYQCTESTVESTKTISTENHSLEATPNYAKEGNGFARITITRKAENGSVYGFNYKGSEETFTAPYTGTYQLETWGAQGGTISEKYYGGYGGYSRGTITLNKNDNLYINVGGQGTCKTLTDDDKTTPGGYNGGGEASSGYSNREVCGGGGATHIATSNGLLSELFNNRNSIVIVSGGGAGSWHHGDASTRTPGHGGGYKGTTGLNNAGSNCGVYSASGGEQSSAGEIGKVFGTFGQGGGEGFVGSAGGGGGYYGGNSTCFAGGGGSGYIGNTLLSEKIMYCYNCDESQDINTKTVTTSSYSYLPKKNTAKEENGYAKITILKRKVNSTKLKLDIDFSEYVNGNEYVFGYTGAPQEFIVPKTGYYQVELWGASGNNHKNDYVEEHQSFGGYTSGKIRLNKGETIYVYVGGQKQLFNASLESNCGTSGGATDIRLKRTTNWYDLSSLSSRIMVAAGSGQTYGDHYAQPSGDAGGLVSYGYPSAGSWEVNITTQTSGGIGSHSRGSTQYTYDGGNGTFGIGGSGNNQLTTEGATAGNSYNSGAGGYYGGGGGPSGGSGSSFISGHNGCVAITAESDTTPRNDSNGNQCDDGTTDITCSKHYSNYVFTDTKMIDGKGYEWTTEVGTEVVGMPTHDGTDIMIGNDGDGFAKITCLESVDDYLYEYTGNVQEFVVPIDGVYKVELWGASGSKRADNNTFVAGSGAYTSGLINMKKNEKYYVYIGQNTNTAQTPSFNGSLSSSSNGGPGGGATDIRLVKGETWDEFDSLKSRIMVAAGGGADSRNDDYPSGSGGGLVGIRTTGEGGQCQTPGTQFSGGTENCSSYTPKSNGKFGMGSSTGSTGGSGWFGGAGGFFKYGGGSGGSSFISGHPGCVSITDDSTEDNIKFVKDSNGVECNNSESAGYNSSGYNMDTKCNKHYSGYSFHNTIMIDGDGHKWDENGVGNNIIGMPSPDGRTTMTGNIGNGYARITLISKESLNKIKYDLDGGTATDLPKEYSKSSDNITIPQPQKDYYTFTGWTGGKNIFNAAKFEEKSIIGKRRDDNGNLVDDNISYYSTYKIPVKKGETIYIYGVFQSIYLYDNNDNFISRPIYNPRYDKSMTLEEKKMNERYTPPIDGYIQLQVRKSYYDSYKGTEQIELGKNHTSYEPYISTPQLNITIPTGSEGNRKYKANWSPNQYQVTLNPNSGTLSSQTINVTYTSTYTNLPTPTRSGYTFNGWKLIPQELTSVEYIELNSEGHIDTEYVANSKTDYEVKVQLRHTESKDACLFGSRSEYNATDSFILWNNTVSGVENEHISPVYGNKSPGIPYQNSDFPIRIIRFEDHVMYVDGVERNSFNNEFNDNNEMTLFLFALNQGGTADYRKYRGTFYYFQLFDNKTLVRDYVPCLKTSNGQKGVLDLVNGRYSTLSNVHEDYEIKTIYNNSIVDTPRNHTLIASWIKNNN